MYLILSFVIVAAAQTACASTGEAVVLHIDSASYGGEDTVQVTIGNRGGEEVLFAPLCDLFVECDRDSGWVIVYEPDCSAIRVRPVRLQPNGDYVAPFHLSSVPAASMEGCRNFRARLRYQTSSDGQYRYAWSEPFALR